MAKDALNEEIVKRLIVCSRYLRFYRHKKMAQDRVIAMLGDNGDTMSQKALQLQLGIRPGSVSELISKLESRGSVVRVKNEEDKRALNIVLTDLGKAEYKAIAGVQEGYEGLFDSLTPEECTALNDILGKLGRDWSAREPAILDRQKHSSNISIDVSDSF